MTNPIEMTTAQFADKVEQVRQEIFGLMTFIKGNGEPMTDKEILSLPADYTIEDRLFIKACSDFSNVTDGLYSTE